jgi:AbiV family abortive infection protein
MSGTRPDPAIVAAYGQAALQNARDLITDATLLLDHQRWPRACSLAILATEEVAKAFVCCILPMLPDEEAHHFAWPLSKINRTHDLKLETAGMLTHVLDFYKGGPGAPERYPSDLAELASSRKEDNERKKRGLYVGLSGAQITKPSEITERDAASALDRAARLAGVAAFLLDFTANIPPEVLALRESLWISMTGAYERGGLDGMAELSQSTFGDHPENLTAAIRAVLEEITNLPQNDAS